MHYKQGYLYLFNRLSNIIKLMNEVDHATEQVDIALLLQSVQRDAEEICTK